MDIRRPAGRLLALLELLQDRPGVNGPALAAALTVDVRTVRRYVTTLQEMGIPVDTTTGRHGGYRLLPGFRLPPLMFSADEAVGLAVALLGVRSSAHDELPAVVASAFGKIERVLPPDLAQQVRALRDVTALPPESPGGGRRFPDPAVLAGLARGVLAQQRCRVEYRRTGEPASRRELEPYGLVSLGGRWYVHGFCHLRQARRTFRVDRITQVRLLPRRFTAPTGLDIVAEVEQTLVRGRQWQVELEVDAPLAAVRAELPRHFAELEQLAIGRTRLRSSTSNLGWFAWRIADVPFALRVVSPGELRDALREHADVLRRMADA
ncbi:MAG: YafY family transcriptional regulator [Nocardioidaceae bacterium]|nr:YafY family transcriptional regulator [Nocardioidaceae bacterium]